MLFHQFTVKKRCVLLSSGKKNYCFMIPECTLTTKVFTTLCKHTAVWSEVSALGVPLPIFPTLV